jgi:hypothetical protein
MDSRYSIPTWYATPARDAIRENPDIYDRKYLKRTGKIPELGNCIPAHAGTANHQESRPSTAVPVTRRYRNQSPGATEPGLYKGFQFTKDYYSVNNY